MQVTFLGTASAELTAMRSNSSLCLHNKTGQNVLVDVNGSITQNCKKLGIAYQDIGHIIITHHHVDHVAGIPILLEQGWLWFFYRQLAKREKPITFYAGTQTVAFLKQLNQLFKFDNKPQFMPAIQYCDIEENPIQTIENIDFTFFKVNHGAMPCFGFRAFEDDDGGLVYSADTEPCDSTFNALKSEDTLVHECTSFGIDHIHSHTTLSSLSKRLEKMGIPKNVYLTHLPFLSEDEFTAYQRKFEADFQGKVTIAMDCDRINV